MISYVYLVLSLVFILNSDASSITKVQLVTDYHIKAGQETRVLFDSNIFDNEHHYHPDERYIDVRKEASFRVEGHASLSGAGAQKADVKIMEIRDGELKTLDSCQTDQNGRCKMLANTKLKPGEQIFMQVKPERDAMITNVDTYLFLAEKRMD